MENITQGQWFRGPSADLGHEISQSIRFQGPQRMVGPDAMPTGNFTVSFWYKRAIGPNSTQTFLMFAPNQAYQLYPTSGVNKLHSRRGGSVGTALTGGLDDHAAWYHIVLVNTSGTTTCYVNGVLQSGTEATPSGSSTMTIGSNGNSYQDDRLSGYLAEFNLLDGQTLAATNFGRFNDDNIWVPIELSFTSAQYGDRGFRLTFDSTQSSGIGTDSAPTGTGHAAANNFTGTDFETTALSNSNFDNDIDYLDTPTNNVPTWNPLIKTETSTVFGDANLEIIDSNGSYPNVMPGTAILRGKSYWEIEYVNTPSGYPYLGLATDVDITNGSTWYSGTNRIFFIQSGGNVNNFADNTTTNANASAGDIRSFAYDNDTRQIQFRLNNGTAFTRTLPTSYTGDVVPMMADALSKGARVNFGNRNFRYTPPSGYKSLAFNNLPEPTIKDGKDHFEAITFTGNATQRNITGLEFQPDLVFSKNTATGTSFWNWHDSVRGATKRIKSNSPNAETDDTGYLNAFTSDGFSVGTEGAINGNGNKIVAYCFKAGGTASSNSDGSLTSSVSANTTAGFSIVSYTGDNSSSQTIGHGLNSAPEMMIVKNRIDNVHWIVYHKDMSSDPENRYLKLDENEASAAAGNSAAGMWANTNPTNSVFSVGTGYGNTNGNSDGMIAYCWHSVEGFSKIGAWSGNASTDGQFVYCGFKPQFLLFKNAGGTSYWQIRDAARDTNNPVGNEIYPATTESENTHSSTRYIDFLSNGFKIRTDGGAVNGSGSTFIFLAVAEHPSGGKNTPPATAR